MQNDHDLQDSLGQSYPFFEVLRLHDQLLEVSGEVGRVSNHPQKIWTSFVLVLSGPRLIDQLRWFHSSVILKLQQGQLPGYLYGMISQQFRPSIFRIFDVDLKTGWVLVEVITLLLFLHF